MIRGEFAGRTFQAVADQLEVLAESPIVSRPSPAVALVDDRLPDLAQRLAVRAPHAHGQEALLRRDVHVEAGSMYVSAELVPKLDPDIGLVGSFLLGEPRVPVNAHKRAAHASVTRHEEPGNLLQARLEGTNEGEARLQDLAVVPPFVLVEPRPVVVVRQFLKELEDRGLKSTELHSGTSFRGAGGGPPHIGSHHRSAGSGDPRSSARSRSSVLRAASGQQALRTRTPKTRKICQTSGLVESWRYGEENLRPAFLGGAQTGPEQTEPRDQTPHGRRGRKKRPMAFPSPEGFLRRFFFFGGLKGCAIL